MVLAWGPEDSVEVLVMKTGKVCSRSPLATLATSGKPPETEELLLCRPGRLRLKTLALAHRQEQPG